MDYFVSTFIILCLSLHACHIDARNVRLGQEETVRNVYPFDKEVVHNSMNAKLQNEASGPSRLRAFLSDELRSHKQVDRRRRTVNREQTVQLRAASGHETTISTIKGNDQADKTKATGRQERLMLGAAHQNSREYIDAHHKNLGYIAEMDYAQPHRKPPIHNEKP